MRDFMTEIKAINTAETIAQELKDKQFTRVVYDKLRKRYHLPAIEFARKHGIIKVVYQETFEIVRNGETINAKRYFYALDAEKYSETMAFMQTRTGLRKRLKKCAWRMAENTNKMKMLAEYNAQIEQFLNLVGQW